MIKCRTEKCNVRSILHQTFLCTLYSKVLATQRVAVTEVHVSFFSISKHIPHFNGT
jgi:hypothetical protein